LFTTLRVAFSAAVDVSTADADLSCRFGDDASAKGFSRRGGFSSGEAGFLGGWGGLARRE
jgi:hypothetical protein